MLYGTPASSDDPESVVLRGHDRTEPTLSAKLHLDGRDGRGDVAVHLLASDAAVEQISAEATLSLPVWAEQYDLGELAVISRPESRPAEEAERREEAVDHAFAAFSRAS